jgi:CubicO group peptidase (beta-lactamase class C family)
VLHVRFGADHPVEMRFGAARSVKEVFLLASITKPMTAAAVMTLVDDGRIHLDHPVQRYIPEFAGGDRGRVTVRNLLTHTSGLPDMLPENEDLRRRHAPLAEFVRGACHTPLLFRPGARTQYQSMGILLAAEIAQRVTHLPFPEFLRQSVLAKLGMNDTSLGLGGRAITATALCEVTANPEWNWNSPYWRNLGAPWGGAHAHAADVAAFLEYFRNPDNRVMNPRLARLMVANQNAGLNEPWGIGFSVKPGSFGRACSARTFGHSGSTGTLAWMDPERKLSLVLLTTRPAELSNKTIIHPTSDAVSGSV